MLSGPVKPVSKTVDIAYPKLAEEAPTQDASMLNKTATSQKQQETLAGPIKDQTLAVSDKLEETKGAELSTTDFLAGLGIDAHNRTMQPARHSL